MSKCEMPIHGTCKLLSEDATREDVKDCWRFISRNLVANASKELIPLSAVQPAMEKAEALLKEEIRRLEEEVSKMRNAIIFYREKPGCNTASRGLAMRRLMWAAGEEYP